MSFLSELDKLFILAMVEEELEKERQETLNETYWRELAEDGSEWGLDPYDFETELEYEEALEEAKADWDEKYDEGFEQYGLIAEDYGTNEEYLEALEKVKFAWRKDCEDGSKWGIYPKDYEDEFDYYLALEDAKERDK